MASPLSLLLPQTHSLPALFSPRFGDDIPGMEGLGTGKLCRMLSCPALALAQTDLIMGEDPGVASVPLACLQLSGSPEKTGSAYPSCHIHAYTLCEEKTIYVCFSFRLPTLGCRSACLFSTNTLAKNFSSMRFSNKC